MNREFSKQVARIAQSLENLERCNHFEETLAKITHEIVKVEDALNIASMPEHTFIVHEEDGLIVSLMYVDGVIKLIRDYHDQIDAVERRFLGCSAEDRLRYWKMLPEFVDDAVRLASLNLDYISISEEVEK